MRTKKIITRVCGFKKILREIMVKTITKYHESSWVREKKYYKRVCRFVKNYPAGVLWCKNKILREFVGTRKKDLVIEFAGVEEKT